MCIQHVPCSSASGAGLSRASTHEELPLSMPLEFIHDHQKVQAIGGQYGDFHARPLGLGSKQWYITHPPSVCTYSWRPECQMPAWGHQSDLWISKCRGGCAPSFMGLL